MTLNSIAYLLNEPKGIFEQKEYPIIDPIDEGMVLKIELSGICGTDLHIYNGDIPTAPLPLIMGHEIIGRIHKLGRKKNQDSQGCELKLNDRVFVIPVVSCGRCYKCTIANIPVTCNNRLLYGFIGNHDIPPHLTGGFAEYLQIMHPQTEVYKLNTDSKAALLVEPLSVSMLALDRLKVLPGDVVAVQGAGPIGLLALVALKKAGVSKVVVIGAPEERMSFARDFGADDCVNIDRVKDSSERVELLKKLTPHNLGFDVVIGCAGVPEAFREGLSIMREGGKFAEIGNYGDTGTVELHPFNHVVSKSATIFGIRGARQPHFIRAIRLIESDPKLFEEMITHTYPLGSLNHIFKQLSKSYVIDGKMSIKVSVIP